jgi:murein DD-endopeptidase MepM/ murein hydrolase activator NlpD
MAKEKFIYNTQTLRYEKVEISTRERIIKTIAFLCAVIVGGAIFTVLVWNFFPSPELTKEKNYNRKISEQLIKLESDMGNMNSVLSNLQERDASVHRIMFGMDPVDENVWNGGIGGHDPFSNFISVDDTGDRLNELRQLASKLKRQISIQSQSLDTISKLAIEKESMLASIPSIKPIREDKLRKKFNLLSGFGMRLHPVHKVRKMHTGIDFTAPRGTEIQATGDGKIVSIKKKSTGYGHHVIVDHGFGYKTLYAHMSKISVRRGQKVTKGQAIGYVGSTGTSTAPHLHYEVIYNGKKVNPINYCMDGLSPEEYEELTNLAQRANQSFD